MSLVDLLQDDVKNAMKARDSVRVVTLRMTVAELKKLAIDKPDALTEDDELAVLRKAVKMRHEAAAGYEQGNRPEQAEKEKAEAAILEAYLPAQLSDDELAAAVEELVAEAGATTMRDMGKVMGPLLKRFPGQLDGNRAKQAVQAALNE